MVGLFLFICPHIVGAKSITIGAKDFTEQHILAEIASQLLKKNGFTTTIRANIPTTLLRQALENGEVDMYFEYNGTAYTVFYKQSDTKIMSDPAACYKWVSTNDSEKGLVWLSPFKFNNTYSIMLRQNYAKKHKLKTISDFAQHIEDMTTSVGFGMNAEFYARPDGFRPLAKAYNFSRKLKIEKMDTGIIYKALKDKQIEAGLGYTTDGRIYSWGFVNLEDNLNYFPVYNPSAVIRKEKLTSHPEIEEALKVMSEKLTNEDMKKLNAKVDIENIDVNIVARDWITKHTQ